MNFLEKAKKVLSARELELFMIMNGRSGTLFLQGHPGGAKSAILESIARKMDFMYIPKWAPAMDELDVGLYPKTTTMMWCEKEIECVGYLPPDWAIQACLHTKGVIIVIEEFNRNERLMNASLSITNERRIAEKVQFPDHVFFAVTGNLGEEDGTSVDVLDTAQAGRMIVRKQTLQSADDLAWWKENYANENIHPDILKFLDAKPGSFRPVRADSKNERSDSKSTAGHQTDARRWTQLSKAITNNFGKDAKYSEYGGFIRSVGTSYIGNQMTEFLQWLDARKRVTLEDVLEKGAIQGERENLAAVLDEAAQLNHNGKWFFLLSSKQRSNFVDFLVSLDQDLSTGFISDLITVTFVNCEDAEKNSLRELSKDKRVSKLFEYVKKSQAENP